MQTLPYEIKDQIIQCFGRCFHYKDTVETFLRSAGVSRELANKYKNEAKFVWARKVLSELEDSDEGLITQRRILTDLCKLRNVPEEVPDRNSGLDALRKLKNLANNYDIEYQEQKKDIQQRRNNADKNALVIQERIKKLEDLKNNFYKNITSIDRQSSGYELEDIIKGLFYLSEVEYKKSYKTDTQQIDGHFKLDGFSYLVEAKWRKDQPNDGEIGAFQRKVNTKLESTRGLFLSVNGFREEVIMSYNGQGANIIFMTGEDLMHILEGRIDFIEALRNKIDKASQYGLVYSKIF